MRHWTEGRVRGRIAICVDAAVIEALITHALHDADVRDPDLPDQHLTPTRAMRELSRVHAVMLDAAGRHVELVTRRTPLRTRILTALDVDTTNGNQAHIH